MTIHVLLFFHDWKSNTKQFAGKERIDLFLLYKNKEIFIKMKHSEFEDDGKLTDTMKSI